ncbi:MAG: hypothetical protein V4553_13025 [Bacteroidota bacterium]
MNDLQLYINDQLVDLSDDGPIALTFQINDLAEVKNQQGNTSNQFKLPLTQNNRRILGFPDDIAFCTKLPYTKYQAKIVQDGLEIIPYGIGELNSVDNNSANLTILSGNVDFFDAIDGKLYEMGDSKSIWHSTLWKDYDHEWNVNNVVQSQQHTDGWIYPVVDYGNLADDITKPINIKYLRPGFFIKTAIDLLVKSTGYKAKGSLLTDPLYPKLIAQFSNSNFEHGTDYQNLTDQSGVSLEKTENVLSYPNGYFRWDDRIDDPAKQMAIANDVFISKKPNDVKIIVTIPHLKLRGRVSPSEQTTHVTFHIYYRDPGYPGVQDKSIGSYDFSFSNYGEYRDNNPTSDPKGWRRLNNSSGSSIYAELDIYKAVISVEKQLPQNGGLFLGYSWGGLNIPPAYAKIDAGATMVITSQQQNVQLGQMVQCERIFPDISQKDLLKDTLQRFGIICQTDNANRTISFNSFHDIVSNIPIAKNWTGKCLDQGKTINFQLGGYAQVNNLKYKDDDAISPKGFADSVIKVPDTTLSAETDLFESQFAPTLNRPYLGGSVAQIKMIDSESDSDDFSIAVSPRILIDQKLNIGEKGKTVTFTDGNGNNLKVNDYISTPYFYKQDAPVLTPDYGPASLRFDDLRKKYYPELEKILQQTKKVVRYFLLNPRDILELDFLIPIYLEQDSAYYYINKIDAWRKGQPVKVELVKLG